ncbi:MAG: hypothetical protein D6723_00025 [Acidobacteria bacterium]|nr:MAG: hypothetical protein D6723_00025 [Acidobacteriota bacterium]
MQHSGFRTGRVFLLTGILLLIEGTWSVPALALDPEKAITQYVHDVWQIEDGLPSNVVNGILQTRDGYIWLTTEGGLVRFDGVKFTVFNSENTEAIKQTPIYGLYEDRDGNLWMGTTGGIIRYGNGRFTNYTLDEIGTRGAIVWCEDREGNLWISTGRGMYRLKDGRFTKIDWYPGSVTSICEDQKGDLWIGGSLGVYRLKDGAATHYDLGGPMNNQVMTIYEDRAGNLWVGTLGGLNVFKDGKFTHYTTGDGLSHNHVRAICEDRDGNLWIGTEGGGLNRLEAGRFTHFTMKQGLSDDRILAISEDREGSLWIGTYGGGLNRLKDGNVTPYTTNEGLSHNHVYTVYEDGAGNLWIGTNGGGLNRLKDGVFTHYTTRDGLSNNIVRSIYGDRHGNLWIGTYDGLNRLRDGVFTHYVPQGLWSNRLVRSIYEDREGNLWVMTMGDGLSRFERGKFTYYHREKALSYLYPAILEGQDGHLWIGSRDGLFQLKDDDVVHYTAKDGLSHSYVVSLYEDDEGVLWIGTYGGGLNRFKDGTFTRYGVKEGLPDEVVYAILEDDKENLWMSGNRGIFCVSKGELNDLAEGRIAFISCRVFGKADGMKSIECSGAHQPAAWKARDGRLWFPTTKGVVVIDPEHLRTNEIPPPVHIEQVLVDHRVIDLGEGAEIPPGKGDLEFHYTALSFLDPRRVRFKYQLEGYDGNWMDAGTRRVAYYTNLPPGRYRFRVIACNNDGVWNEAGAAVEFYLEPHFYQANWFYALSALTLGLIGLGLYYLRINRLKARQRELAQLVEERTSELAELNRTLEQRVQEGIAALSEAERMAAYGEMVAGVAHEVRNPLFGLQAAVHVLRNKLRDLKEASPQLDLIRRETNRMSALMNELLEFARPKPLLLTEVDPGKLLREVVETYHTEHGTASPEIVLAVPDDLPSVMVDKSRILQVLVNLIENAARHAKGLTRVTLSVDLLGESQLCIRVKDDGAGIASEHLPHIFEPFFTTGRGTGLGLAIVQRIIKEHGGTITVESKPDHGTVFTICLPAHRKDAKDAKGEKTEGISL